MRRTLRDWLIFSPMLSDSAGFDQEERLSQMLLTFPTVRP